MCKQRRQTVVPGSVIAELSNRLDSSIFSSVITLTKSTWTKTRLTICIRRHLRNTIIPKGLQLSFQEKQQPLLHSFTSYSLRSTADEGHLSKTPHFSGTSITSTVLRPIFIIHLYTCTRTSYSSGFKI